ncbi:MAG: CRISPR-associated protein Cas4 [Deltaproteobacteria bacterium]|nr:CRISPR-associated protein Cas4 [Deltaproteobacteria bacterium]
MDDGYFSENELLPLSALQHLVFCERQCALIHIEQVWKENRLTAEGRLLHQRVHERIGETRDDLRIVYGLPLTSFRLGLSGRADAVEFHRKRVPEETGKKDVNDPVDTVELPGLKGYWRPFPVEYKRGRPKGSECDRAQLCAQAICLEEMLGVHVPEGALFYGKTRRRQQVEFNNELRRLVERSAQHLHQLLETGTTPPAVNQPKCRNCSLNDICMPEIAGSSKSVGTYIDAALKTFRHKE